ncbi:MAG TPA: nicotinate phosphoribosyltransferase [Steroidobacteraceae bacterium]|nr:nicotinate phosphoribosyltransferase [Steroidobacteraceae bacterium]
MNALAPALLTDLYQLTMAQAYFELGMNEIAVFELFVRRMPQARRFLITAGLEQALEYIGTLRFTAQDQAFLSGLGMFGTDFLEHLRSVRFSGAIHAMPEGTPFFADEPIVRVTAPILEAQLLESRLLNILHFQTTIASKAARCVIAARGKQVVDFGMRRAHEADAALLTARAAYLAGFDATATVEAGRRFGVPLSGTLAHSFIEAHDGEEQALRNFLLSSRAPTTLLIDTYDSSRGLQRVIALAREFAYAGQGHGVGAIRIDSGDLAAQAQMARAALDAHDCREVRIVLSGNLDEQLIERLVSNGVPADAFGVGTSLAVPADVPALDMVYKLQQYAGKPRRKRSSGKATWPGIKQVFRERAGSGEYLRDRVALHDEQSPGEPLLSEVMRNGARFSPSTPLSAIREHCRAEMRCLPPPLRTLGAGGEAYPVSVSQTLQDMVLRLDTLD